MKKELQKPAPNHLMIIILIASLFIFPINIKAQQDVFSRSDASTGNWWDGANPWFYQFNSNQNRPDNFTRNYVKIGHNNNLTMITNGAFFQLASLDFQSAATSVRTINGGGGATGISLTIGIFNASSATHLINADIGIDAATVQIQANGTGALTFGGANIFINSNTVEFGGVSNINVSNVLSGSGGKLTKAGAGTLVLTATNTYSGLTTINAGTLQLNKSGGTTLPTGNNITVNNGGTLKISTDQQLAALVINAGGTVIVDPGVTLTAASITGSGTITGSSASNIVITGTGSSLNFTQTSAATRSLNNLTFNSGSSATLGNALDVYGTIALTSASLNVNTQNLTLKSNASATARIADLTGSSITNATNVTMERYIPLRGNSATGGRAYRLLAPTVNTSGSIQANWMETGVNTAIGTNVNPVTNYGTQISGTGGNANGFDVTQTNAPSLYLTTNAATPTYTAIGNTTQALNALTGYFLYIRGDRSVSMQVPLGSNMPTTSTTLRTTGSLVTGPVSSFTNGFVGGGALNLVTNPYPSPIDWSLLQPACSNVSTAYTLWDPNVGTRGGFVTVTTGGMVSGGGTATKFIQPGQAFFVQASGGVPAVNMQESHKAAGNNNTVFLIPPQAFQTSLYFTEDSGCRRMADGVNVLYDDVYSVDIDGNDATEINNWDENIAINRQTKHLAIESRPVIGTRDTIPLFMNNMKQRNYEFEFTPSSFSNIGLKAELVDNYLKSRTLLSIADVVKVSFAVTTDPASAASNRFMVVFEPQNPLAIDLLTMTATAKTDGVAVTCTARTESNMDRYEVERGNDGLSFTKINTSTAIGNSPIAVSYNWFDNNPNTGDNFYRVKAIDKAGTVKYTDMVKVAFGKANPSFSVSPDPVSGNSIRLRLNNIVKGTYSISIINNLGQRIYRGQLQYDGNSTSTFINAGQLKKGSYQMVLTGQKFRSSTQLIKN